jgi:hypothetical protein
MYRNRRAFPGVSEQPIQSVSLNRVVKAMYALTCAEKCTPSGQSSNPGISYTSSNDATTQAMDGQFTYSAALVRATQRWALHSRCSFKKNSIGHASDGVTPSRATHDEGSRSIPMLVSKSAALPVALVALDIELWPALPAVGWAAASATGREPDIDRWLERLVPAPAAVPRGGFVGGDWNDLVGRSIVVLVVVAEGCSIASASDAPADRAPSSSSRYSIVVQHIGAPTRLVPFNVGLGAVTLGGAAALAGHASPLPLFLSCASGGVVAALFGAAKVAAQV